MTIYSLDVLLFLLKKNFFFQSIVDSQCCVGFRRAAQGTGSLYVAMYPLSFRRSPHIGRHRALSRVPSAIQFCYLSIQKNFPIETASVILLSDYMPSLPSISAPRTVTKRVRTTGLLWSNGCCRQNPLQAPSYSIHSSKTKWQKVLLVNISCPEIFTSCIHMS